MVRKEIDVKAKPTQEQLLMLEAAAKEPITYSEDCPELTESELAEFKRISDFKKHARKNQTVGLQLSPQT